MSEQTAILTLDKVSVGYTKNKAIYSNVSYKGYKGDLIALMGANGAGKSTLLKTIAGLLPIVSGSVNINNQPIETIRGAELTRLISIVLTEKSYLGNFTVEEVITMARYPFTNWIGKINPEDKEQINKAIILTGIEKLRAKNVNSISDGERQKVMIAKALAQETPILLLDEPTIYLDIKNRMEVMRLIKSLTEEHQKLVILSSHQADLVKQFCHKIWMLCTNGKAEEWQPNDLDNESKLDFALSLNE